MRYMLSTLKISLLAMVLAPLLVPNADAGVRRRQHNDPGVNPWSIQFAFEGRTDDNLDEDFNGIRLSLQRDIDPATSFRLSLGGYEKTDQFTTAPWFDSDKYDFVPYGPNGFDFDGGYLSLQYLFYPARSKKVDFFIGIGPRLSAEDLGAGEFAAYYSDPFYDYVDYYDTRQAVLVGAGLETSFGVEWFLGKKLSLLGEYGVVTEHRWYIVDVDYYDNFGHTWTKDESFADGWHFDHGHVKLGLAVHF